MGYVYVSVYVSVVCVCVQISHHSPLVIESLEVQLNLLPGVSVDFEALRNGLDRFLRLARIL